MKTGQLVALSFDAAASPAVTLKGLLHAPDGLRQPFGWGFAWYPAEDYAAMVIKDPTSIGDNAMTKVLRDWERFQSDLFVCHLRGAAERATQEDTQPFSRSYAGRDWIFTHLGRLGGGLARRIPLRQGTPFDPIGRTDSEHAFCWLLDLFHARGVRRLAEVGWNVLHDWLRALDDLGCATILLSDGEDLVIHQDRQRQEGLFWRRQVAPQPAGLLESDDIALDLSRAHGGRRTVFLLSGVPLSDEPWEPMYPGQMLVVRQGALRWNSHAGAVPVAGAEPPMLRIRRKVSSQVMSIRHLTVYRYQSPVERSSHLFRLRPVHDETQALLDHQLLITPTGLKQGFEDVFGNRATSLQVETPYQELRIESTSRVRVTPLASPDFGLPRRVTLPFSWMPWQRQMMSPYLLPPELPESELRELADYALSFARRQNFDLLETLTDLNETIHAEYAYVTGSTHIETTAFEVYLRRRGVCQDFTNLLICLARLLGIPARYRIGYVHTGRDAANTAQGEASHAWAELYLPEVGWRGFDPTNGSLAGADHVRVACGRHFRDASPTSGTIYAGGGGETLEVQVEVVLLD